MRISKPIKLAVISNNILPILVLALISSCSEDAITDSEYKDINFKQEMRNFVQRISQYAREINNDFLIIPQNGQELITQDGEPDGNPDFSYLYAIDGSGREDLYYGYDADNEPTSVEDTNYLLAFCDMCEQNGVEILATDYCSSHEKMDDSYAQNLAKGYISFAAPDRELNIIPDYPSNPFNENSDTITTLDEAKNFLYLINLENYASKQDFITAVAATNYDLLITDLFFNDTAFTVSEITQLKEKQNGGERLVLSYMSIGEAEDYRYYWQPNWATDPPAWLDGENPDWEGNYKVQYWLEDWQNIIMGTENSYLKKILDAGFNGVYLDIIDAFEYYEELLSRR